jgi:hypothetical protein
VGIIKPLGTFQNRVQSFIQPCTDSDPLIDGSATSIGARSEELILIAHRRLSLVQNQQRPPLAAVVFAVIRHQLTEGWRNGRQCRGDVKSSRPSVS